MYHTWHIMHTITITRHDFVLKNVIIYSTFLIPVVAIFYTTLYKEWSHGNKRTPNALLKIFIATSIQ